MNLRSLLLRHEGIKLKPYRCTAGKLTLGVGRNIEDVGITREEALFLLDNDIQQVKLALMGKFNWFLRLDKVRQDVVINMAFNMGVNKFSGFKKMIGFLISGDYDLAAREMQRSNWAEQVGYRAKELAEMMENGTY